MSYIKGPWFAAGFCGVPICKILFLIATLVSILILGACTDIRTYTEMQQDKCRQKHMTPIESTTDHGHGDGIHCI